MTADWPPPAGPGTTWRTLLVQDGEPPVRLRRVRLWGREVEVDADGRRVLCPDCRELVAVTELAAAENGHRVGLPPRAGSVIAAAAPRPARRDRAPWDVGW